MRTRSYVCLDTPLDADRVARVLKTAAVTCITPFLEIQAALFYPPYAITRTDAATLLYDGTKSLRAYGSYCPVCLSHGVTTDCYDDADATPIAWSHHVIYTCCGEHQHECMSDMRRYAGQLPPPPPIALSAIVLGPPMSSRTPLAQKLASELDLVYLHMSDVLARTAADVHTHIGCEIAALLTSGDNISDQHRIRALHHMLQTSACRISGWVLDGFPETDTQAMLMRTYNITPSQVFSLKLGDEESVYVQMKERMERQRQQMQGRQEVVE